MACGEAVPGTERYLTLCWIPVRLPCGIRFCETVFEFSYPCGISWSGIEWCKGSIRIPYPCGIKLCHVFDVPIPCVKTRPVTRYCYDFSSVGGTCYFVYEDVYGCCGGREYNWNAPCFFVSTSGPGSVSTSARLYRKCFDQPLTSIGECRRGKSLPAIGDSPSTPLDEGSVSIKPGDGLKREAVESGRVIAGKLGRCSPCMRAALGMAVSVWVLAGVATLGLPDAVPSTVVALVPWLALILSIPAVGHGVAWAIRRRPTAEQSANAGAVVPSSRLLTGTRR